MNARDFLDVADELATGMYESHWRTAVSRAYYAAFHVASTLLGQCGFIVPDAERAHSYLRLRLMNAGHPDVVEAGTGLDELRKARNRADYKINVPFQNAVAIERSQLAADVVRLLEEAAALPTVLVQITLAMRDYERDVLRDVTWRAPSSP
jgi:uncharacterized protein (UPF0332 family)